MVSTPSAKGNPNIVLFDNGWFMQSDPATGMISMYNPNGIKKYFFGDPPTIATIATSAVITTANTGAVTDQVNYTPPAHAGIYRVSAMVNVTAWTTPASFTVVVSYKDDQGGAHTETMAMTEGDGSVSASALIDEVSTFYGTPLLISIDNSATAITVSTTGTFTGSVSYSFATLLERVL